MGNGDVLPYRVTEQAQADLNAIWDYIAADSRASADRVIRSIVDRFDLLAQQPSMGELHSELAAGLRRHSIGNYVVYYRATEGTVRIEIVRVFHAARDERRLF